MALEMIGRAFNIVSEWALANKRRQYFSECKIGIDEGRDRNKKFLQRRAMSDEIKITKAERVLGVAFQRPQAQQA